MSLCSWVVFSPFVSLSLTWLHGVTVTGIAHPLHLLSVVTHFLCLEALGGLLYLRWGDFYGILPITTPIIKWDFYIHVLHPYRSVKVLNSPGYSKHYNWCQAQHLCFIFYFPSSLSGIVTIFSLSYVLNLCFSSRIFPPLIFKNIFMCPLKMKRHMIKFLSSPPTSYCYYLISFLYESNRF